MEDTHKKMQELVDKYQPINSAIGGLALFSFYMSTGRHFLELLIRYGNFDKSQPPLPESSPFILLFMAILIIGIPINIAFEMKWKRILKSYNPLKLFRYFRFVHFWPLLAALTVIILMEVFYILFSPIISP